MLKPIIVRQFKQDSLNKGIEDRNSKKFAIRNVVLVRLYKLLYHLAINFNEKKEEAYNLRVTTWGITIITLRIRR